MSAIADIIVNQSNPANLQLSQNIKDSLNFTSETGFSDLVSKYQEAEKDVSAEKTVSSIDSEEKVSDSVKENASEEEKTSASDESKSVENKSDKEVKTENIKEVKEEKSEASEKSVDLKSEIKPEKTSKEVKGKTSEEKAKSIVEEENLKYFEEYTASLMNNSKTETETKKTGVKIDDEKIVSALNVEVENELPVQVTNLESSEDMSFSDLLKKDSSETKELKLDKEGKITVQDLRTEKVTEAEANNEPKLKTQVKATSDSTATMTMTYAEETVTSDVLSLNNQTAGSNGSNFQTMLNNQIQANVPEFVKAGNIVLKDNNQGTINLILHPDDLGNVKIHLSLDGKTLTGHITVATKEALQVFKDNSETLREAFIKSGFDAANFEVSYGNSGNGNQDFGFDQRNDGTNLFGKQLYGSVGSGAVEENTGISELQEVFGNYSVNIVA